MDWILFAVCGFYFIRGYLKGFVSMLFSLFGVIAVVFISIKLTDMFYSNVYEMIGDGIEETIKSGFDSAIAGTFSDIEMLKNAISDSNFKTFLFFLNFLVKDISFEGSLSAGQILAPSISVLITKIITFVVVFLVLMLVLKLFKVVFSKLTNFCGLGVGNKLAGGLVGLIKGIFVFGTVYVTLSLLSNFMLNDSLLNFVKSGAISNYIYEHCIKIIINTFY